MPAGLSSKFEILRESPLDHIPPPSKEALQKPPAAPGRWIASRYNIQTRTDDGRLIVWNTFRGSMSVFPAEQRDTVKALITKRGYEGELHGLAGYLRDRGFLIAEGTDEYRLFQHDFGTQHYRQDALELILLASEDCNFRCQYCYEDFTRGTMKPQVREAVKKLVRNAFLAFAISRYPGSAASRCTAGPPSKTSAPSFATSRPRAHCRSSAT